MLFSQFPEYHLRHLAANTERIAERGRRIEKAREAKRGARRVRNTLT